MRWSYDLGSICWYPATIIAWVVTPVSTLVAELMVMIHGNIFLSRITEFQYVHVVNFLLLVLLLLCSQQIGMNYRLRVVVRVR